MTMIRAKHINSIEALITSIRTDYKKWNTTTFPWFRGEPANTKTPLLPKLYRPWKSDLKHNENRLLQWFRMKAPSLGLSDTPPREHTDEWLFLAQHVRLPTRLLDWTEGLFVALYFALLEKKPKVWMLDPVELNRLSTPNQTKDNVFPLIWFSPEKTNPTKIDLLEPVQYLFENNYLRFSKKIDKMMEQMKPNIGNMNIRAAWELDKGGTDLPIAIHPTNIHPRMGAQKSCFTIHGKIKEPLSQLVNNRTLCAYLINSDAIETMKTKMRIMGITRTSIFPELDSLAIDLSEAF